MTVSVHPIGADRTNWKQSGIPPSVISSQSLSLVPVIIDRDVGRLYEASSKIPDVFKYFPSGPVSTLDGYRHKLEWEADKGFTQYLVLGNSADASTTDAQLAAAPLLGSVAFLNTNAAQRQTEIGAIWVVPEARGGKVVAEIVYLLLTLAFDHLEFVRVQWKTHHRNLASQKAALKLGMTFEGTLRNHIIMYDGTLRNSLFYSVIDSEWGEVAKHLEAKLRQ